MTLLATFLQITADWGHVFPKPRVKGQKSVIPRLRG
jgi:hypothetical protein